MSSLEAGRPSWTLSNDALNELVVYWRRSGVQLFWREDDLDGQQSDTQRVPHRGQ